MRFILRTMLVILIAGITGLNAGEWKLTTELNLALTQNAYSDNWAGTELGNITWQANSNSTAEKQLSSLLLSKTSLMLAFGQTHQQYRDQLGDKRWGKPEKSTDKIDLESILLITTQSYFDPFISARWESQFLDLSQPETRLINPHKFTEAAGLARTFIKSDAQNLSARLGGALRQQVDIDRINIGGDKETIITNDGGVEFIGEYKQTLNTSVGLTSRLQLYQALFNSKSSEAGFGDDWKALDLNWQTTLSAKLWSVVTMSLYFELKYEKQEDTELQFKEIFGLGISYRLF